MSRDVRNTLVPEDVTAKSIKQTKDLADNVMYSPTPSARKVKATFWSRYVPSPVQELSEISLSEANEVVQDRRLESLWPEPGFKQWFLNRDENRERLEYLFSVALDTAEEVLINPDVQASAKVNMIKVLGELANKFPSRYQQEKFTDDDINKMNQAQLQTWLEKKGISLKTLKPAEVIESGEYHLNVADVLDN